jgi:hypothetical protein
MIYEDAMIEMNRRNRRKIYIKKLKRKYKRKVDEDARIGMNTWNCSLLAAVVFI